LLKNDNNLVENKEENMDDLLKLHEKLKQSLEMNNIYKEKFLELSTKFEETCDVYDTKINEVIERNNELEEKNLIFENNQTENEKFLEDSSEIFNKLKEQLETSYKEKDELLKKLNILMDEYKKALHELEE
jgi:hypothetical protein